MTWLFSMKRQLIKAGAAEYGTPATRARGQGQERTDSQMSCRRRWATPRAPALAEADMVTGWSIHSSAPRRRRPSARLLRIRQPGRRRRTCSVGGPDRDRLPRCRAAGSVLLSSAGWELEGGSNSGWATLAPPGGGVGPDHADGRAALAFQRIDDWVPPTWPGGAHPQQFHLDFSVGDIDAAEPGILELGAVRADHQPSTDGNVRVFHDPAGHPFCLIR